MTATAIVMRVEGEAFVRAVDGSLRRLAVGGVVREGEVVMTAAGGWVELRPAAGEVLQVGEGESVRLDATPAAPVAGAAGELDVERLLAEEAAAAGLAGGGENAGSSFVRLTRVSETTTPLAYEFPTGTESEIPPFQGPAGAEAAEAPPAEPPVEPPPPPPPPVDREPVAVDDVGRAAIEVRQQEGRFNGNARVMGAGEGAMSFETRLAIPHNQDVWLISDASFKNGVLGKLAGEFTITDKGAGSAPAFVVTPNFTANAGEVFSFTASTDLNPGDAFKAEVYAKGANGWYRVDTIPGNGSYSYTFPEEGEYRVQFTVDDNTGGQGKASATIDVTSDGFFTTEGGSIVTYEAAEGDIFENDTLGDGDFTDHTWHFTGGSADAEGVVTVKGAHGTLTVAPDGTYSYQPSGEGTGGIDRFDYTLTDADGDSATATLTIAVDYSLYDSEGNLLLGSGETYGAMGGGLPQDIVIEGALLGGDAGQSDLDDILENDPGKA